MKCLKWGKKIPIITLEKAELLLYSLKPHVCDHFGISALHYLHGGPLAIKHFQLLINSAIENIETTVCEEFNNAHACILYKGHHKDKQIASSYRTISNCPFVAKALDTYIRELSHEDWESVRAETQFLGPSMSHELGALLLTESISHSLHEDNLPLFCLFLDARSAFDLTVRELIIRRLHHTGTTGQRLAYLDNRLKHRKTFLEWDKRVLGPINDQVGFEQGGKSSADLYILYNNEQLNTAQESGLGLNIHNVQISSIGQADDVVLLSQDITLLKLLLSLTTEYCNKYHVTLAPEKTKLMAFSTKSQKHLVNYQKVTSSISINDVEINFESCAEHVGIVRSSYGNLPHVQGRVAAHNKALFSVLPAGLARNHNANPAASLRVESLYALPVLLFGIAPLILLASEIKIIHFHHKKTLRNLQKLPFGTPEPVIMFLGGNLGATAHIHLRQLNLFGMITRLPENILNKVATIKLYSEPDNSASWFSQIRKLTTQYNLPGPLQLLSEPLSKTTFKNLIKKKIVSYWEDKYRADAAPMDSLKYFNPQFMSPLKPHPIWTTCSSNTFETNKALLVTKLLSGRYYSDWHTRHWSKTNPHGFCVLCPPQQVPGTIEHLLVSCNALEEKRKFLISYWDMQSEDSPQLNTLMMNVFSQPPEDIVQFLLDPTSVPAVIHGCQLKIFNISDILALTRTFCYGLHRR